MVGYTVIYVHQFVIDIIEECHNPSELLKQNIGCSIFGNANQLWSIYFIGSILRIAIIINIHISPLWCTLRKYAFYEYIYGAITGVAIYSYM